jgi:hypothetical protein
VAEVVVDNDGMAILSQNACDCPTYVPSSTGDQNSQLARPPIDYANCVSAASDIYNLLRQSPSIDEMAGEGRFLPG